MNQEGIVDILREVVADQLAVDPDDIVPSTRLAEDLGIDSLDLLQLTCAVEYRFQISFQDGDLVGVKTVGDAAHRIAALVG